ncbi:unnamed protein product [Protopolystoma xenopodis]|uniref:Uncharacterized protein n=1 Tax=Protopolystoma xenopodis TaxID=117903 RepID=A0A448WTF7_9PLAT|nr:unnamed protein product [Protopolystoma xenopodis]
MSFSHRQCRSNIISRSKFLDTVDGGRYASIQKHKKPDLRGTARLSGQEEDNLNSHMTGADNSSSVLTGFEDCNYLGAENEVLNHEEDLGYNAGKAASSKATTSTPRQTTKIIAESASDSKAKSATRLSSVTPTLKLVDADALQTILLLQSPKELHERVRSQDPIGNRDWTLSDARLVFNTWRREMKKVGMLFFNKSI